MGCFWTTQFLVCAFVDYCRYRSWNFDVTIRRDVGRRAADAEALEEETRRRIFEEDQTPRRKVVWAQRKEEMTTMTTEELKAAKKEEEASRAKMRENHTAPRLKRNRARGSGRC